MRTITFHGGYKFRNFFGYKGGALKHEKVPGRVDIPLSQNFGSSLNASVSGGQKVAAGDIIARNDENISSPIHASISGTVKEIKKANYYGREIQVVSIEGDGTDAFTPVRGFSPDWRKLSQETLEGILYTSGVTGLDSSGIPTVFNSSVIGPGDVKDIIIHGIEAEPYDLPLDISLAGKNLFNFTEGVKILERVLPKAKTHIALNSSRKDLIKNVNKNLYGSENIHVYPTAAKFPQNREEVLVPSILKRKFPYGYSAANLGVIVLTVETVLHVYEAVSEGKPLIDRVIAIGGPALKESTYIKVRIGSCLEDILKDKVNISDSRLVLNSLLTGRKIDNLSFPVDKTFSSIINIHEGKERKFMSFLAPSGDISTNLHGEERPCIQCGYCLEVCPVNIPPAIIDRQARKGVDESLLSYGVFNCIDCNLCTYVCPSKIPLAKNIKKAKDTLAAGGVDESKCILPNFNLMGLNADKGAK